MGWFLSLVNHPLLMIVMLIIGLVLIDTSGIKQGLVLWFVFNSIDIHTEGPPAP